MEKTYHVIDFPSIGEIFGKFISNRPSRAASKALTSMLRKVDIQNANNNKFIIFIIHCKETEKRHKYIGTRVKLEKSININNRIIKYRNIVSKYNDDFDIGQLNFDSSNIQKDIKSKKIKKRGKK